MDDIEIDGPANVEAMPLMPPVKRPRLWTVFAVPLAALVLAVVFQTVVAIALIIWRMAQGCSAEQAAQELQEWLSSPNLFMLFMGAGQLAFAMATLVAVMFSTTPVRQRLGLLPMKQPWVLYPLTMFGSLAVLAIGVGFAEALSLIIPAPPIVEELFKAMKPENAMPFVLFIAVFPGVIEELLFRGYVQRRLLERWSPAWAILVSSILFALVHIQPHHVVFAFPLGLWFGVIAWRTGSVYPSMLCHAFVNGGVNAWRMVVKFGEVPETMQSVVNVAAVWLGVICLALAINLLIDKDDLTPRVAAS